MLWRNIQFFNVMELEKKENCAGLHLQRFPKDVRENLEPKGRHRAIRSCGCELRFVTEADVCNLTVGMVRDGDVTVCRGDFFHSVHHLSGGVPTTIELTAPPRFPLVGREVLRSRFSPDVWRILFGPCAAVFYDMDTFGAALRPPEAGELPRRTWLAYGSSITQGVGATNIGNTYIEQAARMLGVDVLNLGLSGSCECEKVVADHIAARKDWDFATLELGVNMISHREPADFAARARYMVETITRACPGKPVFLISIYPNYAEHMRKPDHRMARFGPYHETLAELAARSGGSVHLIEGDEILTDFAGLTSDLSHPSDYGHMQMGRNLARRLKEVVG